jgi:hypothetical protein
MPRIVLAASGQALATPEVSRGHADSRPMSGCLWTEFDVNRAGTGGADRSDRSAVLVRWTDRVDAGAGERTGSLAADDRSGPGREDGARHRTPSPRCSQLWPRRRSRQPGSRRAGERQRHRPGDRRTLRQQAAPFVTGGQGPTGPLRTVLMGGGRRHSTPGGCWLPVTEAVNAHQSQRAWDSSSSSDYRTYSQHNRA